MSAKKAMESTSQRFAGKLEKSEHLQMVFEEWLTNLQLKQDGTAFAIFCTEFVTSRDEGDRGEMMSFCITTNLLPWANFWDLVRPKLKPRLRKIGRMPKAEEFYETLRMSIRGFMVRLWEAFAAEAKKKSSNGKGMKREAHS